MWPYWILLVIPLIFAVNPRIYLTSGEKSSNLVRVGVYERLTFVFYALLLILLIGLRHEVGGDWENYLAPLEVALHQTWLEGMAVNGEPAYGLINWTSAQIGSGVYGVNFFCAIIFVIGLVIFAEHSPQPWLTLSISVPYLVVVVAMGYTRQGVAIGLAMLGLVALDNNRIWKFTSWLILAALFHKSALILLPLAAFTGRKSWVSVLGILVVGALMFTLLLAEYVDFLVSGYLTAQYESSGAAIRVAMNALPAATFLVFRKRFKLTYYQNSFWTWMSWFALGFIVILAISPSSTAVDRLALYWIPLQLYVWSRLPQAMSKQAGSQRQWTFLVLLYTVSVQYVWLFHADHSFAWLPYKFYPWEWLWS